MIKKTKLLIIIAGVLLAGCFKPEEVPPLEYNGPPANMTIAEFQKLHELSATNPATLIENDAIITGIVTSTDKYGSCYKEIYFQDGTGGICIRTSNTAYYKKYAIGQRIFVQAKGLYLENYVSGARTGFYQIGMYGGEGGTQYLSSKAENQHVFRDGVPLKPTDPKSPAPKIITKAEDIVTGIGGDYHTLVKLTNCYFADANGTTKYFEKQGTSTTISRVIKFNGSTKTVEARISEYCTFANDTLPRGNKNIIGILTMFDDPESMGNRPPQLIIRSINDVDSMPVAKILKTYDMSKDPFTEGWTTKQLLGSIQWTYNSSNKQVDVTVPKETATESWLLSPKLNFAGEKDVVLTLSYRINNGTKDNIQALYTIDGTNWIDLGLVPNVGGWIETTLKLPQSAVSNPNLQVAFKCKTDISTSFQLMWAIKNIAFKANVVM